MYTSLARPPRAAPAELRAWALYDVANSAWMTTTMTAVFPYFFVVLGDRRPDLTSRRGSAVRLRDARSR
jgi:MFS-type transporter involved in bile tolerance (Atg22 family)